MTLDSFFSFQGYLELNPDLKQLKDKVAAHTKMDVSPTTKKIKTVETIKDENGEIIDIKETIIEQKIEKDEVSFNPLCTKTS